MSGDEGQPDPARALSDGLQAMGRSIAEWAERWRPLFEQLEEVMNRPEVRAAIEQRQVAGYRPCRCFCGIAHPAEMGICDGEGVATRRLTSYTLGVIDVPVCAPCAAAQGVAEMEAATR